MAKGKTNQPLTLMVDLELSQTPEVQKLRDQGHVIVQIGDFMDGDIPRIIDGYLGRKFWRMTPELIKYLPMALKAMRKAKNASKSHSEKSKPKKTVRRAKKGATDDPGGNSAPSIPEGTSGGAEDIVNGTVEPSSD